MSIQSTVVIPTHNRPKELMRALKSLYQQARVLPDEIIVIDDGSAPPVPCSVFEGCPDQIRTVILRNPTPEGANRSRNRGIHEAKGELIFFLDDDDEFLPGKIHAVRQAFMETCADIYYHPAINRYDRENVEYINTVARHVTYDEMLIGNVIGGTSMVAVKKRFFIEIGGFDESLPALQDYEAWLRAMKHGAKMCFIPEPLTLYHYLTGARSISKSLARFHEAVALIEHKYGDDYRRMAPEAIAARREWVYGRTAHKNLMNHRNWHAARDYLKCLFVSGKLRYAAVALASVFGVKAAAWLRSRR